MNEDSAAAQHSAADLYENEKQLLLLRVSVLTLKVRGNGGDDLFIFVVHYGYGPQWQKTVCIICR